MYFHAIPKKNNIFAAHSQKKKKLGLLARFQKKKLGLRMIRKKKLGFSCSAKKKMVSLAGCITLHNPVDKLPAGQAA